MYFRDYSDKSKSFLLINLAIPLLIGFCIFKPTFFYKNSAKQALQNGQGTLYM